MDTELIQKATKALSKKLGVIRRKHPNPLSFSDKTNPDWEDDEELLAEFKERDFQLEYRMTRRPSHDSLVGVAILAYCLNSSNGFTEFLAMERIKMDDSCWMLDYALDLNEDTDMYYDLYHLLIMKNKSWKLHDAIYAGYGRYHRDEVDWYVANKKELVIVSRFFPSYLSGVQWEIESRTRDVLDNQ